jgi:GMC oxidoreductase
VRYKTDAPFGQRFNIEDLTVPRAYRNLFSLVARATPLTRTGTEDLQAQHQRREKDAWHADPSGALNSSLGYLCMAHDDSAGRLYLDGNDHLRIDWPGAGREPIFNEINRECFAHAKSLGASFIENDTWQLSPWKTLVTAHPLGGCPMGEDGSHGVVDHFGKVFHDDTQAVHDGLYVADGSYHPVRARSESLPDDLGLGRTHRRKHRRLADRLIVVAAAEPALSLSNGSASISGERMRLACWFESLAVASRPLQRCPAETNFVLLHRHIAS